MVIRLTAEPVVTVATMRVRAAGDSHSSIRIRDASQDSVRHKLRVSGDNHGYV